jgi:hypothetical protein
MELFSFIKLRIAIVAAAVSKRIPPEEMPGALQVEGPGLVSDMRSLQMV